MKKQTDYGKAYSPVQKPKASFFGLTFPKFLVFGAIFLIFNYYTTPKSMISSEYDRIMNSFAWLIAICMIYFVACFASWAARKVKG